MNTTININDYLSHDEIKQIAEDQLRQEIKSLFNSENESQRLLSNLCYEIVFNEIDKVIPNSQKIIVDKTMEVLNDVKQFHVFRDGSYGSSKSAAFTIMENAVKNNVDLINEKVKETIVSKDYSKEIWDRYEEMADTFMSNFYEIVRLGRNKNTETL